ncbi:MAG TPA: M6 family metalloprotease domain-containing protein [Firmicutes bacterium]|nr:M6 family metalloprotease domain-containing protein [Candidatus Fermentithermobacillaceae bacterium]
MLFVDFPNAPVSEAPDGYRDTQPYYEWLAPAAREWFRTSSYGRLNLETTPVDRWYHMSRNDYEYGFRRGLTWEAHVEYIKEAVRLADNDVDFSLYDLVYIVPTRNASNITYSPAFIDDTDAAIIADRKPITHGVTFGQDMWHWGYKVLNHETLHTFGLPDTYAFVPKTVDSKNDWHYYVGGWDLMGLISGHAPDLFAWHKWKLGWIDDTQVDVVTAAGTTEHHLTPVERPGGPKMVVIRTGNTTAYVVESRRSLRNDSDAKDSGVLIYRVDSSVWTGHGCIQVIDASPGGDLWPSRDLDLACFGTGGGRVSTFTDEEAGITITVIRQAGENDFVRVTKTTNLELQ